MKREHVSASNSAENAFFRVSARENHTTGLFNGIAFDSNAVLNDSKPTRPDFTR